MTNCNNGAGKYTLSGMNISFDDATWTELACDNMATEEAMRSILPMLRTVEVENDSVMRINSDSEPYLILLKAREIK
ncbi:MAG: META domain-containing protein [Muribaculaceae bacterium]|nr:META domain-containing protein [Muribaculaceae bacterium]